MVVTIEQIREKGLTLDEPVSLDLLSEALQAPGKDTGFRATRPSELHAFLRKVSSGVLLEGSLQVQVTAPCKRCIAPVEVVVPVSFTLNLIPVSVARASSKDADEEREDDSLESEGSFGLDDVDQELFDGKTIDLDPIIREQVLLALPMSAVCREDCQGLCAQCGQNLNEKKCGCALKVVDPRLAVLKDIKLN